MEYLQIDIMGNEVKMKEPEPPSRKFKTMQQLYGTKEGFTCKTCEHVVRNQWNRVYYKCELWKMSNSTATDIRLKNTACGKYEKEK